MRLSKKNCISVLGLSLFVLQILFSYCSVLFIKEELFLLLSSSSSLHQKLDLGLEVCLCVVLLPLLRLWIDVAS
jgi:hypothetical protein